MIEYYFQPMYVKEYIAEPILFMPSNEADRVWHNDSSQRNSCNEQEMQKTL